ncbi:hypothetical protein GCM10007082_30350 [Oceanisphaera arctica]|nr:hypothetical protein GCM10007082_30350 [Oceanisphaera arctica]
MPIRAQARAVALLAHTLGKQSLSQYLVGFVGAAVQQIFPLQVDAGLGVGGQVAHPGQWGGAAGVFGQQLAKFTVKLRVLLGIHKGLLQLQQGRHQNLRHVHAAKIAEKGVQ